MTNAPSFHALAWWESSTIPHPFAVVVLDRTTNDFAHLIQQVVQIDGEAYMGHGVEHFAHVPPYRQGEQVSLCVSRITLETL